jgi:OFA family oxalate/formate antiporter-like MFS transporter
MNSRTHALNGTAAPVAPSIARTRWFQLGLGLVCMMTISSPQYVWTLMTRPLAAKLGIALPELQVTFSILVLLQAFFSPFQGALIDRFGPRLLISIGTVLAGVSWVLASYAHSTPMLYLTYGGVGGLGTGIVYVGVVGLMVRWFPDRRGFAAGAVAAGYGMGAIVTTFPIAASLASRGVESASSLPWSGSLPRRGCACRRRIWARACRVPARPSPCAITDRPGCSGSRSSG